MSLSSELNEVIKQLQACRVSLALTTEHVQFESDTYAQLLLWCADLEFIEMLVGMWMEDKKLTKEERLFTKHIKHQSHTSRSKIERELMEGQWIGTKHDKASS